MPESPSDYDSPWKEALEYYFEAFLALLAPWLHEQIDWSQPPVFLDKELQAISLGVLTDSASNNTHLTYVQQSLNACSAQFRFPIVNLSSWLANWDELIQRAAHNPFAVVVMAQLQAQQTRKNSTKRLASKTQIVRLMYQYDYSRENVLRLFRLIDWMMALPAALEPAFERAMITIEQEHKMTFVTSIERLGEKRGLEKGLAQGKLEGEATLLQRLLVRKFGPLSESLQQRIRSATPDQLEAWSLNILDAATLDDVFD